MLNRKGILRFNSETVDNLYWRLSRSDIAEATTQLTTDTNTSLEPFELLQGPHRSTRQKKIVHK